MANQFCGSANIPERRQALRTPYDTPVHYTVGEAKGAGMVKDLSSEGMFMESPHPFEVGDRISLDFQFRNTTHPMTLEGEVARRTQSGVGVKFIWS